MLNAQRFQSQPKRGRIAARDDHWCDARFLQKLDALAVEDVEALKGFTAFRKIQTPIGQHAVDVKKSHPHTLGL